MIEQTLLQRLRPEGHFARNIASAIEQMRQRIGRATGGSPAQEVALGNLRDYVAALGCDDQALVTLAATARAWPGRGSWLGGGEPFEPTEGQRQLLQRIGTPRLGDAPTPEIAWRGLVAAGVIDFVKFGAKQVAEANEKAAAAERKAADLERVVAEQSEVGAQREKLQRQLEAAKGRVADLEEIVADQRELLGTEDGKLPVDQGEESGSSGDAEQSEPAKPTAPRRRRAALKGEEGIYESDTASGTVFEIRYPDDQGEHHWRRLPPETTLEEARALRAELAGKPHTDEKGT
jgi:hypothetical protein